MNTKDYILVINTYTEAFAWSNRLIFTATEFVKDDPHLAIYAEHMNLLMMDNDSTLCEFKTNLFEKYGSHSPRALLLLGNSTLMLRDDFRKVWGDVPIILCSEKDYIGPREYYLRKHPVPPSERIPLTELAQPYNLVLLYSNQYIRENLELMFHILPDMKKLIYVGDQRFVNQTNSIEIQEVLQSSHPGVQYTFLSPENILETNQLIDSLNFVDPRTTGILFSSWFYKRKFAGNTSLSIVSPKIVSTVSPPLFALSTIDVKDKSSGMTGGYSYNQTEFDKRLLGIFSYVLNGRQPRTLPYYYPLDGMPIINYETLIHKGFSPDLCPANTYFINKPRTFWEQYSYFLIGTCISIVLLVLFFQYRIRTLNRLKKTQLKEIETMTSYKNLINNMPILYMQEKLITNEQGIGIDLIYLNVNPHFEQNFFRREDAVGKKASEMFPESLPEFLHFIQMSLKENRVVTFPYYFKKINRFYDIVLKGTHQNNVVDIFCLDSTELHLAQQKLTATNHKLSMALDVANIIPWKWDLLSKTILCDINKPIELSSPGNSVNDEQLAVPDTQYFSKIFKEDRKRVEQAYKDLIEGRTDKVKEEYRVINVQNHTHKVEWVEAQAAVESRDENGNPTTLVGSSLVITKRKKMEMELTTAKDRAEESNRLKSAFLANMSHEIRTPLNAIVGFSRIIAESEDADERKAYYEIVDANNERLLQLINEILDLSKIESGIVEFSSGPVKLHKLCKEIYDAHIFRTPDGVELIYEPSDEILVIDSDKNRIFQVISNLIGNAFKFTKEGSISYGYRREGERIVFHVTDTGTGIAPDKVGKVFERFMKLNSTAQGTGLGLSICKTIIERLGGGISVTSEPGKGSTFSFWLPAKEVENPEDTCPELFADAPPANPENGNPGGVNSGGVKPTLLIAEDTDSNYELLHAILGKVYNLVRARDGMEAVTLFDEIKPDLILMDIKMPNLNGLEATKIIRELSPKVPIIMQSAFAYEYDRNAAKDAGCNEFITKPVAQDKLKMIVKRLLYSVESLVQLKALSS